MKKILVLAFIFFCAIIMPVSSWGFQGHRVVAYIAQKLVSERTMEIMQKMFQKDADLVYYSTRPDDYDHCVGGKWSAKLHYVDADGENFDQERDCKDMFCVYGAVLNYTKRLHPNNPQCYAPNSCHKSKKNPEPCPLEFFTHFFADITMPLHVGNSKIFPAGGSKTSVYVDFIRNAEKLKSFVENDSGDWNEDNFYYLPVKRNGNTVAKTTIHKVWDSVIIGEYLTRTYNESYYYMNWGDDLIDLLMKDDQRLFEELSREEDPFVWTQQTLDVCNAHVANYDMETKHLTEDYYQEAVVVINMQIMTAAARLTKGLNALLQ